jgi:hypothetical protein
MRSTVTVVVSDGDRDSLSFFEDVWRREIRPCRLCRSRKFLFGLFSAEVDERERGDSDREIGRFCPVYRGALPSGSRWQLMAPVEF